MATVLELLGKEKFAHYKQLHFLDSYMISGKVRYHSKDQLYKDMRYNFAFRYADYLYPDTAQSSKWLKEYDNIIALPFSEVIEKAEEFYRKERKHKNTYRSA